jgi:hypothetical protein
MKPHPKTFSCLGKKQKAKARQNPKANANTQGRDKMQRQTQGHLFFCIYSFGAGRVFCIERGFIPPVPCFDFALQCVKYTE